MTESKLNLDFSCESSSHHYFKSSFAKSIASNSANKTKSLDYHVNFSSKIPENAPSPANSEKEVLKNCSNPSFDIDRSSLRSASSLQTDELDKRDKEESSKSQAVMNPPQSLPHNDMSMMIDTAFLQSQLETLQWQLKQTEGSRKMYRALTEQVVKFLERLHKSLDIMVEKSKQELSSTRHRVPRSRSVHTVDVSPTRLITDNQIDRVPRVKSAAQIEETENYSAFRDFTWRRPKKINTDPDDVPPEKLSQEAFRLLRTAQSLLNTKEPDLTRRILNGVVEKSSPKANFGSMQDVQFSGDGIIRRSSTPKGHISNVCNRRESSPLSDRSIQDSVFSLPLLTPSSKRSSRSSMTLSHGTASDMVNYSKGHEQDEQTTPSMGSCSSLFREVSVRSNTSKLAYMQDANTSASSRHDATCNSRSHRTSLNSSFSFGQQNKNKPTNLITASPNFQLYSESRDVKPTNKQLSVSSNEDESGFSSMSSFQEVGVPLNNVCTSSVSSGNYPELGLPVVDSPIIGQNNVGHQRWISNPVEIHPKLHNQLDNFRNSKDSLRVLWV